MRNVIAPGTRAGVPPALMNSLSKASSRGEPVSGHSPKWKEGAWRPSRRRIPATAIPIRQHRIDKEDELREVDVVSAVDTPGVTCRLVREVYARWMDGL